MHYIEWDKQMQRRVLLGVLLSVLIAVGSYCTNNSKEEPSRPTSTTTITSTSTTTIIASTTTALQSAVATTHTHRRTVTTRASRQGSTHVAAKPAGGDVWARLAQCESGMRNVNTGNGYYGYFQFSAGTWRSVGGSGLPHHHDYATQLAAAQRLQARSGWGQWPICSRKLGLR